MKTIFSLIFMAVIAVFAGGCAQLAPLSRDEISQWSIGKLCQKYRGLYSWTSGQTVRQGGLLGGNLGENFRLVRNALNKRLLVLTPNPVDKKILKRQKKFPALGMSEQLLVCYEGPGTEKSTSVSGTGKFTQYVYESPYEGFPTRYFYVHDGIVTEIVN